MKKAIAILAAAVSLCLAQETFDVEQQCEKTFNINEIVSKVKNGFPRQLKSCTSRLKNMSITDPDEMRGFITQCVTDDVKDGLPGGFPITNELAEIVESFVQNVLIVNSSANGEFYPKKFMKVIDGTNLNELLGGISRLKGECVVDEPYEEKKIEISVPFNFLIVAGFNFSHTYSESSGGYYSGGYYSGSGTYKDIPGMQLGFAFDIPTVEWLSIQPGFMYIRKGMEDNNDRIIAHYVEIPLILSLKFSVLRLDKALLRINAGPYLGLCLSTDKNEVFSSDFGLTMGIGADIDKFYYIGIFYDHGLTDISDKYGLNSYNRTLGLNVGMYL